MSSVFRRFCLILLVLGIAWSTPAWAQQTGTLAGVVRDAQGGVLPGVTVTATSPALISPRTTTTSETGNYQLTTLPPGVYVISYEITGFNPLKREGIAIEVARTTRLEVELTVGALQETVTVSGESPVVDVSSNVTQTNITRDLYEAIPTGRNPWVMAGLVPGVVTGRLDVGGTEGMQQYNLEAFGSADSQKSFSIDGLKTNWPGGNGGSTMQYYGFEMYEEYNMQTASGTAESDVSGVYMNMVTKSGGNDLHSDHNLYFMNDALQGENLDDDLRRRLGLGAGAQTGAAGNPIDISYDWSSTLGGPIRRDKAWFFGAMRWWRLDQFQIGALNPDGSQAIDDNRIRNFMGKVTYQVTQNGRSSFMFNRNLKDRFHRRDAPYLFVEDKASVLQDQPAQNFVLQHNHVIGAAGILDARFGRMWGTFPSRYQPDVGPTDIALRDVNRNTRVNAAEIQSLNPNHRYQANGTFSYFVPNLAGAHDFKAGAQLSWEKMQYDRIRNGDILLEMRDGVPFQGQISNTPIVSDHRVETWGLFLQDRWGFRRATINLGLRIDGTGGNLPAQSSPAGTYVGERSFSETDVYDFGPNVMPRIGISYDLRGNGQTAIKAYAGRFYNQFGSSDILEQANPNALATQNVVWNDNDGDLQLDAGELGAIPAFARGLFPTVDPDSARPFSDEFNVGIEHQIVTSLAVGVSYHRRHHRDGLGVLDRARPPSAYTPEERTYTDGDGQVKPITIYKLRPEFGALRDRVIANVAGLESTYNGVQFDVQKKMSNRWQMLAGLSIQKHEGFDHSGTFTNVELNNPNARINRDNGSVFIDLPWAFTLSGSYLTPWWDIALSGKYTARAGDPLNRTVQLSFTNPTATQPSEVIRVVQRGVDRTDDITKFLDLRFSKRARFGRSSLEGTVDLFNVLNANHVLEQVVALGGTFGRPSRILTPRIVRFGVTARF